MFLFLPDCKFLGGEKKMDIEEARHIMSLGEVSREVKDMFEICNALWIYQGSPNEPHALLTKGGHSDAYFNVNAVTQFPNFRRRLGLDIMLKLADAGIIMKDVDVVVSSTYAATSIGQEVADYLDAMFVFTEKDGKDQIWSGRFEIPSGARVLQVEELITTLSTTEKVRGAVLKDNSDPVEFIEKDGKVVVATIVHRPSKLPMNYSSYEVMALMEVEVHNWDPEECPLCKQGSEALKPKPNWQKFLQET